MSDLQPLLDDLRQKHNVVGATLGVVKGGTIETAASGLLNLDTAVEATPDSVFQIGSIGKIFTTTLVMQLVDEGRLGLDDPVIRHLPDFTIADRTFARAITVRQLLNHTSGLDGDFFPADDPEGPSTASYLRKMYLLTNLYPPGDGPMTYCNSGFVVAGRIVEILTGMPWQRAVVQRIIKPLGLSHVAAWPQDGLRYRCAMGHIFDGGDMTKLRTAPVTFLALSAAAAGSVLSMSVESVLKFAAAHMADAGELVSAASSRRMREETIAIPPFSRGGVTDWGLGWMRGEGEGYRMAGHDGGTFGQYTYMRTFPEQRIAFALFTNSPSGKLYEAIEAHLLENVVGTKLPADPPSETWTPDPSRYAAAYENVGAVYTVDNDLAIHIISKIGMAPDFHAKLKPYREDVFTLDAPNTPSDGQKISFLGEDDKPTFIRQGTRMGRRV
jgi:CubicO group peptidase (beta-lactamase class C family)